MANPKKQYAAIIVANIKDDKGGYARGVEFSELEYTETKTKKAVNVMRADRKTSGFTEGVVEVKATAKIPLRIWDSEESYDFKRAMDEKRILTVFAVRDGIGSGTILDGLEIEEIGDTFNADGEAAKSLKMVATEVRKDLSRRAPF